MDFQKSIGRLLQFLLSEIKKFAFFKKNPRIEMSSYKKIKR